jgi:hypothetical protein
MKTAIILIALVIAVLAAFGLAFPPVTNLLALSFAVYLGSLLVPPASA